MVIGPGNAVLAPPNTQGDRSVTELGEGGRFLPLKSSETVGCVDFEDRRYRRQASLLQCGDNWPSLVYLDTTTGTTHPERDVTCGAGQPGPGTWA